MSSEKQDFQARLARLEAAKPPKAKKKSVAAKVQEKGRNALYPLSFVGAFLLGIVIVFAVRFIRFQMSGDDNYAADFFVFDAIFAGLGGWVFAMMFRLKDPLLKATQGFGTTAMLLLMHNLAFWAPQTMSVVFNEQWVEVQHEVAEPNSVRLMQSYIPFRDPDSGKKALPKVTYTG